MVVVGLGNPGRKYCNTRHNIGFFLVDYLADKIGVKLKKRQGRRFKFVRTLYQDKPVTLVQPQTYMNNSGEIIHYLLSENCSRIDDLLVICDSIDMELGSIRLRLSGSSAGNKGLASILQVVKTDRIKRISLGVGRPKENVSVPNYVLSRFTNKEFKLLDRVAKRIGDNFSVLLSGNYEYAMNLINCKYSDIS